RGESPPPVLGVAARRRGAAGGTSAGHSRRAAVDATLRRAASGPPPRRLYLDLCRRLVLTQQPDRAGVAVGSVVAVAVRVLVQVLLVVGLGVVERARRRQLGGDRAVPGLRQHPPEGILGQLRGPLLLRRGPVDRRAVLRADVVALPVRGGRVVVLPEGLEQPLGVGAGAVVGDEHRLGVPGEARAHLLVRRVGGQPAHVPGRGGYHARQ